MKEEWLKIVGFENYKISNLGRLKNSKGETMKPWNDGRGYFVVKLHKNKKSFHRKIHRLVAEAFIPNPENKPQVNHIDRDPTNNKLKNLEWVTAKENINHMFKTTRILNQFTKLCKVAVYDFDGKKINEFETTLEAARELGFKKAKGGFESRNINDCCRGHKDSYKNLRFRYFKDKPLEKIEKYIKKKKKGTKIEATNLETFQSYFFETVMDASKQLKIDRTCIFDVLNGKAKQTKNFIFKKTK